MKRLISLGLAALLSFSPVLRKPVEVEIGYIKYNKGPIVSNNFFRCSAVILDYNNEAVFAHAMPKTGYVKVDNVVDLAVREAKRRDFDLRKTKAFVNTWNDEYKERILRDLKRYGIRVEEAKAEYYGHDLKKDMIYNPRKDSLHIEVNEKKK
ncbi:hypothetical protein KY345_02350 [Candidatus Woesearchaeota archaeon]|nr:hypothetical protein [Candidatus Woesearchaeota archaeon]